jgi:hypothetical protein
VNTAEKDTYDNWVERVIVGRGGKPLSAGDVVQAPAGTPFGTIEFVKIDRPHYKAEIGKKGGDYIYHLYPKETKMSQAISVFEDRMGDAFLEVFQNSSQLEAGWTPEMKAWAVRARGFATLLMGDELAIKVLDVLDKLLEK